MSNNGLEATAMSLRNRKLGSEREGEGVLKVK